MPNLESSIICKIPNKILMFMPISHQMLVRRRWQILCEALDRDTVGNEADKALVLRKLPV